MGSTDVAAVQTTRGVETSEYDMVPTPAILPAEVETSEYDVVPNPAVVPTGRMPVQKLKGTTLVEVDSGTEIEKVGIFGRRRKGRRRRRRKRKGSRRRRRERRKNRRRRG